MGWTCRIWYINEVSFLFDSGLYDEEGGLGYDLRSDSCYQSNLHSSSDDKLKFNSTFLPY